MMDNPTQDVREVEREMLTLLNQVRAINGYSLPKEFPEPPYCSFCGRYKKEMGALVAGLDAHICVDCAAEACRLLLRGEQALACVGALCWGKVLD